MKIIAHRGLMVGPDAEAENQPDTLCLLYTSDAADEP